ncbi:hypothetical protein AGABI2DRAFT_194910, partial [Agaricus bisporus var. bisporus H97]|uniref:hypothetical protein n=1 Tax=Agaricus bisporus var. bisporus (strain H97 / ATCC MYA-4626 / FGSC 10389) TaxID=936046 RepID=UPI00029F5BEC
RLRIVLLFHSLFSLVPLHQKSSYPSIRLCPNILNWSHYRRRIPVAQVSWICLLLSARKRDAIRWDLWNPFFPTQQEITSITNG